MPADFDGQTCPRCGASTLATPEGERYCSNTGGGSVSACSWGLGAYDRGPNEGRPVPPSCPVGHPAACVVSALSPGYSQGGRTP